jgi:triosephosphate isomerase
MSIAELVAAELFEDEVDVAKGVSGDEIAIIPGRVRLELLSDEDSIAWTATVGFAEFADVEAECSLLGHSGCLEYFFATFDGVNKFVELTPRF